MGLRLPVDIHENVAGVVVGEHAVRARIGKPDLSITITAAHGATIVRPSG